MTQLPSVAKQLDQTDERAACPEENERRNKPSRKKTKYDLSLEASAKENYNCDSLESSDLFSLQNYIVTNI